MTTLDAAPESPVLSQSPDAQDQLHSAIPDAATTLSRLATIVATGAVIVYIVALWLLFVNRADKNWDRLVLLLSGYESIVFAAVGALFGTTVQRSSVRSAQMEANQARSEARSERGRADANAAQAAAGMTLARSVKSIAGKRGSGQATGVRLDQDIVDRGAPREVKITPDRPSRPNPDMLFLADLAEQLFPPVV